MKAHVPGIYGLQFYPSTQILSSGHMHSVGNKGSPACLKGEKKIEKEREKVYDRTAFNHSQFGGAEDTMYVPAALVSVFRA